ncbi:hypothetical protein AGOR_G00231470 [Albula goreensis]|uniref:Proteasome component Ecm29 N-terminal domain-containing protein n=1 Tax=Albula goreensis TaxID=1534307 RepID=A0A8T3CI14_9TELE|nr:hypothetical protein AGOR_G00231470 [Albula goreensis]
MAAQDELNQLERVFLRLGHAETDEQLQDIISKFLPPVLLKLSSTQEGVRKKVMELLVHLNKRIKSRPKIQLPVETLLVQYQDPAAASFVTNFTIIYIKMGYPRLEVQKQCELAPTLLTAMEGKPQPQQDGLMHLLIPTLFHMKYPAEPSKVASPFILVEKPKTVHLLLDFMLDVLLMPYGFVLNEPQSRAAPASPQGPGATGASSGQGLPQPPPGMSFYAAKRIIGETPWSPEQLEQCKLGIVKFIEAEQVPEVEAVVHLVIASSDTRHSVATAADLELKSKQSIIDWNNPLIINKMYKVYLGDIPLKTKEGAALKPELKREPVSTRVKLKILPHLLRSRLAAETFPANIQVVYDGLFGANTNNKLRSMSLQFVHHICVVCPDTNKPLGLMLLNGLTKLINEYKEDPKLLCVAYSAVGKLSSRMPQLFTKDIALVQQFFEAMCKGGSRGPAGHPGGLVHDGGSLRPAPGGSVEPYGGSRSCLHGKARGTGPSSGHEVRQHGVCPRSCPFQIPSAAGCWRPEGGGPCGGPAGPQSCPQPEHREGGLLAHAFLPRDGQLHPGEGSPEDENSSKVHRRKFNSPIQPLCVWRDYTVPTHVPCPQCRGQAHHSEPGGHAGQRPRHRALRPEPAGL